MTRALVLPPINGAVYCILQCHVLPSYSLYEPQPCVLYDDA